MKAIETIYKGYRFRSRLEARWAVFFDALGIKWEYEPEGFEFDDVGTRYLPDFFLQGFELKDSGLWVEVKPTNEGFDKAKMFAERSGNLILCVHGTPDGIPYRLHGPYEYDDFHPTAVFYDKYLDRNSEYRLYLEPGEDPEEMTPEYWGIKHATDAARGTRFEFEDKK